MGRPQEHNSQVHAEIEDLEYLGLGEGQDKDATKLGQSDSAEYLQKSGVGIYAHYREILHSDFIKCTNNEY